LRPQTFDLLLLGSFAGLALLLAAIGIYGVMAYAVTQRQQEIGVRMAMGARPRDVLRLIVRQGMSLAGSGVVAGIVLALLLTRFLASLLFGVSPAEPLVYGCLATVLALVALAANLLPALRAARVDPMIVLRSE
jgi:putative ABC transport system permease protein